MSASLSTNRLHNLDYLRGLAALSIMLYHYAAWSFGRFDASDFLGRVGLYGVSIFYVLSGLTLFHVYFNKMEWSGLSMKDFYLKRFFRIFPLLWLTIILNIIITRDVPDVITFFLNVTGLFGVVRWNDYIGTGVWSIGNELCFYLFFPVFVVLAKKNKSMLTVLGMLLVLIFLYFAFARLPQYSTLTNHGWHDYVNPLNQVLLFFAGFLIGYLFTHREIRNWIVIALLGISVAVFAFYPVEGDRINLVVGSTRIVFVFLSIMICFCFFKLRVSVPPLLDSSLSRLGEYSYSLYLLHPLVWYVFKYGFKLSAKFGFDIMPAMKFLICALVSLALSRIVYLYFEKYFMRKGKAFTDRVLSLNRIS